MEVKLFYFLFSSRYSLQVLPPLFILNLFIMLKCLKVGQMRYLSNQSQTELMIGLDSLTINLPNEGQGEYDSTVDYLEDRLCLLNSLGTDETSSFYKYETNEFIYYFNFKKSNSSYIKESKYYNSLTLCRLINIPSEPLDPLTPGIFESKLMDLKSYLLWN